MPTLASIRTVLTDAVMAGTDNLIARVEASGDLLGYVAAGVARPITRVADLRAALERPQPAHPAARRTFIEDHFRPGDASDRIVDATADEISEAVATSNGRTPDVEAADPRGGPSGSRPAAAAGVRPS